MLTRIIHYFLVFNLLLLPVFSQTSEATKVELKFSIDSRFDMVKGVFKKASFMVKDRKAGTGIVEINVASIDAGNSMRDSHLRGEDFFDVEKFPKAEFEVLGVEEFGQDIIKGKGKLTIKGITKELVFQAKVSKTEDAEKFVGSIKINRKDFGINYNSMINPISDTANLEFTVILPLKK